MLGGAWGAALNSVVGVDPLGKVGFEQKHEGEKGMSIALPVSIPGPKA